MISIRNVSHAIHGSPILHDISLDLPRGGVTALIGPNGAGKSTLIKQISGEIAPDAGEIRLDGRSLSGVDAAGRARLGMARSFQVSSVAAEFTVLQNVVLAVQGASGATFRFFRPVMRDAALLDPARDCIAQAGLTGREDVPAAELAHGERRKLEIAMALALRPRLFLLDEPMAGMGTEGARALGDLLDGLRHRAPILLVEHDMDAVFRLSDRVSVLVYGRVVATGTPDEIRADPEVQRVYLGEEA